MENLDHASEKLNVNQFTCGPRLSMN